MKKRNCRICGKENPPNRYFNCNNCEPVLESEDAYTYPEGYDYGLTKEVENDDVPPTSIRKLSDIFKVRKRDVNAKPQN